MKKILFLLLILPTFIACEGDDEITDPSGPGNVSVSFNFTQNFDDEIVRAATFGSFNYTNANGELMSFTRLRYLISKIQLHYSGGVFEFDGYQLVDLTDANSLTFSPSEEIPPGTYTSISFVFGFNQIDNIDGNYPDLNIASWNWPAPLGGGYHFMQFEGMYEDGAGIPQPFAYHNGTARVSTSVFEQNFIEVTLPGFTVGEDGNTIEIKMNIAEWFKNPNLWDLNTYNINLMGNYDAQILMHQNGASVFSLGTIN